MTTNLYEKRLKEWEAFQLDGTIMDSVRPIIARSWIRSREYGVPMEQSVPPPLPAKVVDRCLEDNRMLLEVSHPFLHKLMNLVSKSGYVITLHDRDGYIIDYVFDSSLKGSPRRPPLYIGSHWVEAKVGTNGAHVAMIEDMPVQIIGPEHYCKWQHAGICSAAPFHNAAGEVIGCVNMTGYEDSTYTLGIVAASAYSIETQLMLKNSYSLIQNTFDSISEGIVVMDPLFHVKQVSRYAAQMLGATREELEGTDFRTVLKDEDFEEKVLRKQKPFQIMECDLCFQKRVIPCNVSITPLHLDGQLTGLIVVLREARIIKRVANYAAGYHSRYTFDDVVTQDETFRADIRTMQDIADTSCCVLLEGESGTGKELLAHSIHSTSYRRKKPFVVVNCASLPRNLVESELFGYERGAFTGALREGSPGKFELADGGTIFLDEIGELPLEIQPKLLRVLDNHRISRIGSKKEMALDVRVIAATNRDLFQEVQDCNFRSDLYYRINVMRFLISPLRERRDDIILLAEHFLNQLNESGELRRKYFSQECINAMTAYHWPGNARELQNAVVRAYYASLTSVIELSDLPAVVCDHAVAPHSLPYRNKSNPPMTHYELERDLILRAIEDGGRDMTRVAELLGISRATLYRRLKTYNISTR